MSTKHFLYQNFLLYYSLFILQKKRQLTIKSSNTEQKNTKKAHTLFFFVFVVVLFGVFNFFFVACWRFDLSFTVDVVQYLFFFLLVVSKQQIVMNNSVYGKFLFHRCNLWYWYNSGEINCPG